MVVYRSEAAAASDWDQAVVPAYRLRRHRPARQEGACREAHGVAIAQAAVRILEGAFPAAVKGPRCA
jgi:hypothetical protein